MRQRKNIVLVHGWGRGVSGLGHMVRELSERGWQVETVKLPGFDLEPPRSVWGTKEYADYVEGQIPRKWVGEGYVFFGHSFGGRLAVRSAASKKSGLAGVVLCAPGGFEAVNKTRLAVFRLIAAWGKEVFGGNELAKKMLYRLAGTSDYLNAKGVMRQVFKKVVEEDLWPSLAVIDLPVLVLWGDKDRVVGVESGAAVKDKIRNGRLEICRGQGHLLPYIKPHWVAERIDEWYQG